MAANPELFQEGKVIVVSGRIDNRNGDGPKLVAQEMQEIIDK
jgi:cytochrome c-type biogenesis protein CcmE